MCTNKNVNQHKYTYFSICCRPLGKQGGFVTSTWANPMLNHMGTSISDSLLITENSVAV